MTLFSSLFSRLKILMRFFREEVFWVLLCTLIPQTSFASGGDVQTITDALQGVLDIMTGSAAKIAATIAIAAAGIAWKLGKISLNQALTVAISIGIIFGAAQVASALGAG